MNTNRQLSLEKLIHDNHIENIEFISMKETFNEESVEVIEEKSIVYNATSIKEAEVK